MEWAHMDLNLLKQAMTGCSNKSKLKTKDLHSYIQSQNITYKSKNFPALTQNEAYTNFGIRLANTITQMEPR